MIPRKLLGSLLVIAAAVAGAVALVMSRPAVPPTEAAFAAPFVRVIEVHPGPVAMVVESQGTVSPRTVADLIPEVSGEVVWTSESLVAGGYFQADEPLLRIDRRDYGIALDQARAAVDRAEAERELAWFELTRQQEMERHELISAADVERAQRTARVADATLAETQAELARAELDLERTNLRAPFEGVVRTEQVDAGQFVSRGEAIASLYAIDYVEVRLPVADRQLAWLDLPPGGRGELDPATAPPVTLTGEYAGEPRRWTGRLARTGAEIDADSRMVHVVARVDAEADGTGNRGSSLPPIGLFVQAEILGRSSGHTVVLPRSAVRTENRVLVVDGDERLRFRTVQVVRMRGDDAYIGAGLDAGEWVCVSALQAVTNGMRVRIADDPEGNGSGG